MRAPRRARLTFRHSLSYCANSGRPRLARAAEPDCLNLNKYLVASIVCRGSGESGKLLLRLAIARHTFGAGAGTRWTALFHDELVGGAASVSASCTGSETYM